MGRLIVSTTGSNARHHTGQGGTPLHEGPYSQIYGYDVWGNRTSMEGWGGAGRTETVGYTNNKRNGFTYDAAGNLTNDLGQTFTYDATGQQATASYGGYSLQQYYDGDRLRVKKVENSTTTYYLRSSVLGGQVVAEFNASGGRTRGYVYLGGEILAVQQNNQVSWMHQDLVAKSKRVTDGSGGVVSTLELDPWGGETTRSSNSAFQPRHFTTYERDGNASDEAMHRRYNRWHSRFDQPDPYGGSYDMTNPQSFNRYAYVQNDPVNFVDPTGLFLGGILGGIGNVVRAIGNWLNSEPTGGIGGGGGHLLGGDPHMLPEAPTGEGDYPQTPAPGFDRSLGTPPPSHNQLACDAKLARIFGGPGSVVGSTHDPGTIEQHAIGNRNMGRTPPFPAVDRLGGHGPEPYNNPDPKNPDRGGIIHIYGNATGTTALGALYAPAGGKLGKLFINDRDNSQINVSYSRGPLAGLTISFIHANANMKWGGGPTNAAGSVRIGGIGGRGGIENANYIHTHIIFRRGGREVDPRSIFCKEFGF